MLENSNKVAIAKLVDVPKLASYIALHEPNSDIIEITDTLMHQLSNPNIVLAFAYKVKKKKKIITGFASVAIFGDFATGHSFHVEDKKSEDVENIVVCLEEELKKRNVKSLVITTPAYPLFKRMGYVAIETIMKKSLVDGE